MSPVSCKDVLSKNTWDMLSWGGGDGWEERGGVCFDLTDTWQWCSVVFLFWLFWNKNTWNGIHVCLGPIPFSEWTNIVLFILIMMIDAGKWMNCGLLGIGRIAFFGKVSVHLKWKNCVHLGNDIQGIMLFLNQNKNSPNNSPKRMCPWLIIIFFSEPSEVDNKAGRHPWAPLKSPRETACRDYRQVVSHWGIF